MRELARALCLFHSSPLFSTFYFPSCVRPTTLRSASSLHWAKHRNKKVNVRNSGWKEPNKGPNWWNLAWPYPAFSLVTLLPLPHSCPFTSLALGSFNKEWEREQRDRTNGTNPRPRDNGYGLTGFTVVFPSSSPLIHTTRTKSKCGMWMVGEGKRKDLEKPIVPWEPGPLTANTQSHQDQFNG